MCTFIKRGAESFGFLLFVLIAHELDHLSLSHKYELHQRLNIKDIDVSAGQTVMAEMENQLIKMGVIESGKDKIFIYPISHTEDRPKKDE